MVRKWEESVLLVDVLLDGGGLEEEHAEEVVTVDLLAAVGGG
jgi:hypothetical protein